MPKRFRTQQITYANPGGAEALDRESMTHWLDRNGASGWLRKLIEVAYTTEMGLECDEQSALNLLTFIGSGTEEFRIFGESDERFHVRGGNDQIPQRLGTALGASITTGCVLEALRRNADGRYVLSFKRGAGAMEVRARRVVLAIPFTTLRRVHLDIELPPAKRRAIAELRYGTNAKLMIGFNERVWRTRDRSSGSTYSDLPLQTTWETSRMQPGAAGILTNFVGGRHGIEIGEGTPKMQADAAAAQLDAIYSGHFERARRIAAKRASTGRVSRGRSAAMPASRRASGRRSAARSASVSAICISPASIARSTTRASWKAASRPANGPRRRFLERSPPRRLERSRAVAFHLPASR